MTAWVLKKAVVLVHAPEFDHVACLARLRMSHDRSHKKTGFISMQVTANIAGFDAPRTLALNIRPEMVDTCAIALKSNENLIPTPAVLKLAPAPVTKASAMSTLTLCLNTPGVVLKPLGSAATLIPTNPYDVNFHAFSQICRAKTIRLHFSSRQLGRNEQIQLEAFFRALRTHDLKAEQFDLSRFDAGRGAEETDWRVFDHASGPGPPTYCEAISHDHNVLGKRGRESRPSSEEATSRKLAAPNRSPLNSPNKTAVSDRAPSFSPTIPNTPTTPSSSPSRIRPTKFTNCDFQKEDKLMRIQQELEGTPDHVVRGMLIKAGHQHLLVPEQDPPESMSQPEAVTTEQVDAMISQRLNQFVDQRLAPLTKDAFKSLTRNRLDSLVESHLPVAAELFLNSAVSKHRDHFYEDCKANSANLREEIDEGITELREVANECCKEIQEQVQQYMHDNEFETSAEDKLTELKVWVAKLTQCLFDKEKTRPAPASRVVRRSSL